ncbi:MAG: ComEC/Rec2 family competence protein [bacterium]|nr:ComEC/Rec2 family competence protein [bacterium]
MSRPDKFLICIAAFAAGIFLASLIFVEWWTILLSLVLSLNFLFWTFLFKNKLLFWGLLVLIFIGGIIFYQGDDYFRQKNSSAYLNGQDIIAAKAIITSEPENKDSFIWLKAELASGLRGKILIKARPHLMDFQYGDEVSFAGKFEAPQNFGDFDFKAYLAKESIYSVVNFPEIKILSRDNGSSIKARLFKIKDKFEEQINRFLPEPEAGFLAGLILGARQNLDADLKSNLQRSGTSHLIALSGYNITIVAAATLSLFLFFGLNRRLAFWFSVAVIALFVLMTGASASVVRAAIMGILLILGQRIGRIYYPRNALFLAVLIMIVLNPRILRFDLAFQLSAMATLGLIYFSPFFQKIFKADRASFLNWRNNLATTLSAQVAVFPLLISGFGYFSLIAPISNILILTLIPITMLFGFLMVVGSLTFNLLGQIIGFGVYWLLKCEIGIINFFGSLKLSSVAFGEQQELVFWLSIIFVVVFFLLVGRKKYGQADKI